MIAFLGWLGVGLVLLAIRGLVASRGARTWLGAIVVVAAVLFMAAYLVGLGLRAAF